MPPWALVRVRRPDPGPCRPPFDAGAPPARARARPRRASPSRPCSRAIRATALAAPRFCHRVARGRQRDDTTTRPPRRAESPGADPSGKASQDSGSTVDWQCSSAAPGFSPPPRSGRRPTAIGTPFPVESGTGPATTGHHSRYNWSEVWSRRRLRRQPFKRRTLGSVSAEEDRRCAHSCRIAPMSRTLRSW